MGRGLIGAFFDFDRTLIDVESPRLGIRYLWERGLVTMGYILKVMAANVFYQRHLISDETMARILISFYRGKAFALSRRERWTITVRCSDPTSRQTS